MDGIAQEVKQEVAKVETEVKDETKTLAADVEKEVRAVVEPAKEFVVKAEIEITTEEKLAIREIENQYLKAQMEISRLSQQASLLQKQFPAMIDQLTKKYVVSPAEYLFDSARLIFTRKTK